MFYFGCYPRLIVSRLWFFLLVGRSFRFRGCECRGSQMRADRYHRRSCWLCVVKEAANLFVSVLRLCRLLYRICMLLLLELAWICCSKKVVGKRVLFRNASRSRVVNSVGKSLQLWALVGRFMFHLSPMWVSRIQLVLVGLFLTSSFFYQNKGASSFLVQSLVADCVVGALDLV